jgi:hypothetical protein
MGAWGHGSFENDGAGDWAVELMESSDFSAIDEALDSVLENEDDHLEVDFGERVIAACEVVAALAGRPSADLPDEVAEWVKGKAAPEAALFKKARQALKAILTSSESRDLWEESEHFADWQATLADLQKRLGK